MSEQSVSGLERPHLKYLWGLCFVVVAVFSAGMTPWEALGQVVANDVASERSRRNFSASLRGTRCRLPPARPSRPRSPCSVVSAMSSRSGEPQS